MPVTATRCTSTSLSPFYATSARLLTTVGSVGMFRTGSPRLRSKLAPLSSTLCSICWLPHGWLCSTTKGTDSLSRWVKTMHVPVFPQCSPPVSRRPSFVFLLLPLSLNSGSRPPNCRHAYLVSYQWYAYAQLYGMNFFTFIIACGLGGPGENMIGTAGFRDGTHLCVVAFFVFVRSFG